MKCVCLLAVRLVIKVFINAVYGVLYRTGGLCSPACGRGVCVCL